MMENNPSRPARKVLVADHIWDAFEEMAESMGSDRDNLINQAMFMFARLNGFLEVAGKPAPAVAPKAVPKVSGLSSVGGRAAEKSKGHDDGPAKGDEVDRREVAERVLETAAELERLIKGKAEQKQAASSSDGEDFEDVGVDVGSEPGKSDAEEEGGLFLMAEGGDLDKIAKERFIIGRGKHCDFVINSGKVSREHAVIVKEGEDFFIEDLGSSNGTWFNKQRIKRRKIEDGDEYYICSEKVKFVRR